jgi:hypothetical protein
VRFGALLALAAALASGGAQAQSGASGLPASSSFCDRAQSLSAGQQDKLLRW